MLLNKFLKYSFVSFFVTVGPVGLIFKWGDGGWGGGGWGGDGGWGCGGGVNGCIKRVVRLRVAPLVRRPESKN